MKRVTIAAFGKTGGGKSEFLNAFLQEKLFEANSSPNSVTFKTSGLERMIGDTLRCGIDTQGLDDSDGLDAKHIMQMVDFLINFPHGINAFLLVINVFLDRLDGGTKKLIKIMHTVFNNSLFWNQVGIVFTHCFPQLTAEQLHKKEKKTIYREAVLEVISECVGTPEYGTPPLPVFFIDSVAFNSDKETMDEITHLLAWASSCDPLKKEHRNFQVADPSAWKHVEEERLAILEIREEPFMEEVEKEGEVWKSLLKIVGASVVAGLNSLQLSPVATVSSTIVNVSSTTIATATTTLINEVMKSKEMVKVQMGKEVFVVVVKQKRLVGTSYEKKDDIIIKSDWEEKDKSVVHISSRYLGEYKCVACQIDISHTEGRFHSVLKTEFDLCCSCHEKREKNGENKGLLFVKIVDGLKK